MAVAPQRVDEIIQRAVNPGTGPGNDSGIGVAIGQCRGNAGSLEQHLRCTDRQDGLAVPMLASGARFANFGNHTVSPDVRHLVDWIADSGDHGRFEFVIVDKRDARLHVFDSSARLRGSSPELLGAARGDESVPGIGSRPLSEVRPDERTTPAGRFVAERGHNLRDEDVIWVNYDDAVSMHRVLTTNPEERRLERLATLTSEDNRISYRCINVPVAFYEAFIRPIFSNHRAVVYVLPETKPVEQVFASYDVAASRRLAAIRIWLPVPSVETRRPR